MFNVSPDLVELARSQVVLLTQTLGAVSSAMYVAEEILGDRSNPNLIEVVTYPDALTYTEYPFGNPLLMLPSATEAQSSAMVQQGIIVIPLIYQDGIMGFLMTGRDDRDWTDREQMQIQQVANTLAIACALDRRSQWLRDTIRDVQRDSHLNQENFIASLLHQLRNPLTALRTFGQLLLRRIVSEDPNHQLVAGIIRETRHIQDLLVQTDMMQTDTLSPPKLLSTSESLPILLPPALELGSVDLSEILENLVASASAIAQAKNLKFNSYIPSLPLVWGNTLALREVLNNLLDNAIKYTPEFGTVSLSATYNSQYNFNSELVGCVEVKVRDTGVGIPEADLSRLFERNFRGRQSVGNIAGTGLGLAIARDLVEKMAGEIKVESELNVGSCFTVLLKAYQSQLTV